jgi:hypothetical protein
VKQVGREGHGRSKILGQSRFVPSRTREEAVNFEP